MGDIPGLIDGAHENKGIGHEFLKHIERTKVLLIVVDAAGTEGRTPADDLKALIKELTMYKTELVDKSLIVFANKSDIFPEGNYYIGELKLALKHLQMELDKDISLLQGSANTGCDCGV